MELIANPNPQQMILNASEVTDISSSSFIDANTKRVTLEHLKNDCIIPVFSKDNETSISHFQFINTVFEEVQEVFQEFNLKQPEIRISHVIKGRVPSAIGKPVKELLDNEKTIYYERCAFIINIPQVKEVVNGNELTLSIGGVRAYNQENLYSKKSLEKFKVFIGFKNTVCLNLCVSTDGFSNQMRIGSILDLIPQVKMLFQSYDREYHLLMMQQMINHELTERQFAHLIGKARMYQHLCKSEQRDIFSILLNDSQINQVVKKYYNSPNFSRNDNGSIDLWRLYNLFTGANKSSYIDHNLERNVNTYEFINNLGNSIQNNTSNWYLDN
jgi:Domain of unknown function, B. Theta Gene description (DUF3871)